LQLICNKSVYLKNNFKLNILMMEKDENQNLQHEEEKTHEINN
jgi:hypothetical protein